MRPMKKGAARTGLQEGLEKLATTQFGGAEASGSRSALQAAVLGGAIDQAIQDLHPGWTPGQVKEYTRDFWRLVNENTWRLTRALEASGTLDKAGQQ